MQLDYESRRARGRKGANAFTIFLMMPVRKVTLSFYCVVWVCVIVYARLPPAWREDPFGLAVLVAFLNTPLVLRVVIRKHLCQNQPDYRFGRGLWVATAFALVFPLLLFLKIPMQIGFTLSRPAMNGLRQWALTHPGGKLPPQRIGVYWAEGITATPDGVRFRVCGTAGAYGSRSGFACGSTIDEVEGADLWATWDPTWKAFGWDY